MKAGQNHNNRPKFPFELCSQGGRAAATQVSSEFAPLRLGDLAIIATLGVGGFGRVELVSGPTHC